MRGVGRWRGQALQENTDLSGFRSSSGSWEDPDSLAGAGGGRVGSRLQAGDGRAAPGGAGRNREAGSASASRAGKEAARGPGRPARAPWHVRRLRREVEVAESGRAEGGPGRRGAAGGRRARASSADARPAPKCWGLPRCRATSGRGGYGPLLGLSDRPSGLRVAARLGPQRAAAPGDSSATVLLPGEGCARRGSPSGCPRPASGPARPCSRRARVHQCIPTLRE